MKTQSKSKEYLRSCILVAIFASIIAVCSFIAIPSPIPFTLQSLAIFSALTILGGKRGLISIILYIMLGIIGLPVFSGFSGGIGHLLGATGGYIWGFIFTALVYLVITRIFNDSVKFQAVGLVSGLLVCYISGTTWYTAVYLGELSAEAFFSSLTVCVVPFLIPDIVKIILSILICRKLSVTKG